MSRTPSQPRGVSCRKPSQCDSACRKYFLHPAGSLSNQIKSILEEEEIRRCVDEPPETTRARLRGEFIRRAKEKKRDYTVDWVHLKLNDQAQRTVLCKDPFRSEDERVQKLIDSL